MISLITLGGNTVSVVSLPASPGLQSLQLSMSNANAVVTSVFTGQVQVQQWPGADMWSGIATLPPLTAKQANAWKAALLECRGMAYAIQLNDPMNTTPAGVVQGTPLVDGSIAVTAGSQSLYTKGWTPSQANLLLPGDYIQVGYRLYMVLDPVISDSSGKAVINISPSLREVPVDGEAIITTNPLGLFRLAENKVTWSSDFTKLTRLSFQVIEYR